MRSESFAQIHGVVTTHIKTRNELKKFGKCNVYSQYHAGAAA